MSTVNDFASSKTWQTLINETGPTLYKAARCEFETILGGGDVCADDIQDIQVQGELIKNFLASYVDGLTELFCVYGKKFYGEGGEE